MEQGLNLLTVSELKRHSPAPRKESATTTHLVKLALEEFGLLQLPTVNIRNGKVIHLWSLVQAYKEMGEAQIACWCVDLDEAHECAAVLMLNSHLNEWDWQAVAVDLKRVRTAGIPLHLTGMPESDIGPLLAADWSPAAKVPLDDASADSAQQGLF